MLVCGNILSTKNYNYFALRCVTCEATFGQWASFIKHLHQHGSLAEIKDPKQDEEFIAVDNEPLSDMETTIETTVVEEKLMILEDGQSKIIISTATPQDRLTDIEEEATSKSDEATTLKTFQFNLHDDSLQKISLEFIKILKTKRMFWDEKDPDYDKPYAKTKALIEMKLHFKKNGYLADNLKLRRTISHIVNKYEQLSQELHMYGTLNERSYYFLDICSFFKEEICEYEKACEITCEDDDDDDSISWHESETDHVVEGWPELVLSRMTTRKGGFFKRIRYNTLPDNKIAVEIIELFRKNQILWDSKDKTHDTIAESKRVIESWISHFQEKFNLILTYDDLDRNIFTLRSYYREVCDRKVLDEAAKYVIKKCSFLPKRKTMLRINCDHCDSYFRTQPTYQAHLYSVHQIGESPYRCEECNKSYKTLHEQRAHTQQIHVRKYDFPCTLCDYRFMRQNDLIKHMYVHTDTKKFVCATCGKRFRGIANLKGHETRVHLRQRNFRCHLCPKAFYTKGLLKDHINAHLNIRNFKCPFCPKAFHSSHARMRHKQIHSEEKRYACKVCDAKFHQFVGLNAHMKTKHAMVKTKNQKIEQEATTTPNLRAVSKAEPEESEPDERQQLSTTIYQNTDEDMEAEYAHSEDNISVLEEYIEYDE